MTLEQSKLLTARTCTAASGISRPRPGKRSRSASGKSQRSRRPGRSAPSCCAGSAAPPSAATFSGATWRTSLTVPIPSTGITQLPRFVGPETLVIISSYSGNTEETVTAHKEALAERPKCFASRRTGRPERLAGSNKVAVDQGPGRAAAERGARLFLLPAPDLAAQARVHQEQGAGDQGNTGPARDQGGGIRRSRKRPRTRRCSSRSSSKNGSGCSIPPPSVSTPSIPGGAGRCPKTRRPWASATSCRR